MAQTNHAWRKVVSVFLCLVMCFTSYVLCVPTASAVVTDDGASMKKTDKYGTAPWDGSDSSMASYAKWYRSSFWIQVNYAPHIYLDVSETLQSAGYKMKVTWNYGNDAGDYRILLTGAVWGENDQLSGFPAGWYAITNLFSDFSVDASSWTTTRNGQVIYGEDWRVDRDNWDNYSNDVPVLWQSGSAQDHTAYLYLQGTPNAAGTATYSTVQGNELFVVFIDDTTFGSESEQQKPAESNVMIYDAGQYWPEISYQVTVYDKSALQAEINKAEAFRDAFQSYQYDNILSGDWRTFVEALEAAKTQIKIREQEQSDLDAAQKKLQDAANAIVFHVDTTDLDAQLSVAAEYANDSDFASKYTASSIAAFNTAYQAAQNYTKPGTRNPYAFNTTAAEFNSKASEFQNEQNQADTLASNLDVAIRGLLQRADFSRYDEHLAEHPVNGTCYTAQSWSDYNTAKQAVETLKANAELSLDDQTQVKNAIDAYIAAYDNLVEQHIYNDSSRVEHKSPATCTESGEDWQYCSVCDEAYQVITLDPLGHTIDYLQPTGNSFAGDCQNAPWTEYKCSVCGEAAKAYGVLNPDAHVWDDGIENPVHNCTQAGTKTYTCTVDGCGETKTETVPADGTSHVESDRTNVIPATCEEDEVIQHLCAYCDEVLSEEIVPDTALGHDYTVYVSNTAGDCVTNATTTYKCSRCDATTVVTGDVNPAVHKSASLINVKTPTCLEEGYSGDLYCSACQTTVETGEVKEKDPANHASTETKVINRKDSTCTEAGYSGDLVHSCCEAVITPGHELELAAHEMALQETVVANCQHGGYELWACANCEYTEKRNETGVNAENHANPTPVLVDGSIVDPKDCTKPYNTGDYKYTCCGTIVSGAHDAPYADHEWDDGEQEDTVYVYHCTHEGCEVTKEESCHHTGGEATCSKKAICTNCGEEYGNLNPDNHKNIVGRDAVAATCTTDGREAGTYCNDCGKWVTGGATIEKTGHDYQVTATEVITKATCKTPATIKYTYTCANGCGDTYDETKTDVTGALDSENHEDIVTDAAIAATCTTPGKTKGSHCEACDTVIVAQQETTALGHDWSDYVQTTDPTCTEAGEKTATCQREGCGATKTEPVPATGHSYGEWYIAKESTCTEYGYEQRDCANCDAYERRDLTELAEHDYQWVTTGGSCTEGVTKQLKCTVCGDIKETITEEPTGHTLGEWTVTVEPGCTTAGSRYALCSVCGETVTESIPATGHTYGEGVLILHPEDADDGIGLMRYTCINCGYWYDREITDTGHTHHGGTATCVDRAVCEECGREYGGYDSSNHVNVVPMPDAEATCETDGHTGGTYCTACGATVDEPVITTPATGHVDADGDGICDVDGKPVTPEDDDEEDDIWSGYRCKMCDEYEENKDKPFIGFFYMIIHFFVHLISYINHLT